MAITENRPAIGVFRDRSLAEHAIEQLHHSGLRDDEILVWGQGASTGGFLETLRNKLSSSTEAESISSSLTGMGVSQEDADYYQREVDAGHVIVAVHSYGHSQQANDILYRSGAYTAQTSLTHDLHTIPLREEVLTAQTQPVEIGEVFIRKEVITEEKTITVTVQREEIVIERRKTAAQDTSSGEPAGRLVELSADETIRIPIREEQVFIEKRPVVTGELIVGKRSVQEIRRFSDTVRREVPHVDSTGDVIIHGPDIGK
ncbi:MAG TPA: YsnF/AvaK domain-containing protein [Ktedonobacteraceae bacterium]